MRKQGLARKIGLLASTLVLPAVLYATRSEPASSPDNPEVTTADFNTTNFNSTNSNTADFNIANPGAAGSDGVTGLEYTVSQENEAAKTPPSHEDRIRLILRAGRQGGLDENKSNYHHPRVEDFYDLFTGEQSRDIQARIERTRQYDDLIRTAAENNDLPYETLFALVVIESGGNPNTLSSAGARGLTQMMSDTANSRGCYNLADPATSINCGATYLAELRERFGSLDLALAAYNIGPTRTSRITEGSGSENYWDNFDQGEYVPRIRAVERVLLDQ